MLSNWYGGGISSVMCAGCMAWPKFKHESVTCNALPVQFAILKVTHSAPAASCTNGSARCGPSSCAPSVTEYPRSPAPCWAAACLLGGRWDPWGGSLTASCNGEVRDGAHMRLLHAPFHCTSIVQSGDAYRVLLEVVRFVLERVEEAAGHAVARAGVLLSVAPVPLPASTLHLGSRLPQEGRPGGGPQAVDERPGTCIDRPGDAPIPPVPPPALRGVRAAVRAGLGCGPAPSAPGAGRTGTGGLARSTGSGPSAHGRSSCGPSRYGSAQTP